VHDAEFDEFSGGAELRAKILRLSEITGDDWERWQRLAARATMDPNPELDPRSIAPEQHADGARQMLLAIAEEGDEWFGIVRLWPHLQTPILGADTYGTPSPGLVGPSHPLLDPGRAADALAVIARGASRALNFRYLALSAYPATGYLASALKAVQRRPGFGVGIVTSHEAAWVHVSPETMDPALVKQGLPAQIAPSFRSRSTRKVLRRDARSLEAAAGGQLVLRDVSDDPAAVSRFIGIQASGWKGDAERGGLAVALTDETAFRLRIDAFRSSGDLIILELWAGDIPVYSQVVLVEGRVGILYLDAYQHEFAEYSTGTLGRTAVCAHLMSLSRLTDVHPGIYDAYPESTGIYPHRRGFDDVVIGVGLIPAVIARLLSRAHTATWFMSVLVVADRLAAGAERIVRGLRSRLIPVLRRRRR
jgi:hypothetical protein